MAALFTDDGSSKGTADAVAKAMIVAEAEETAEAVIVVEADAAEETTVVKMPWPVIPNEAMPDAANFW